MTDDQLEDLLVRQGESWRAGQPAAPSLGAMTRLPTPRDARASWLLPALVAAAVLVLVVGTVTLLRQHDPHRPGNPATSTNPTASPAVPVLVPWADLPAPARPAPSSPPGLVDDGVPPEGTKSCQAGDFAATSDAVTPIEAPGAAPWNTGRYLLTVQRVGSDPCAIGGQTPTVNVLDAAGNSLGIGRSSSLVGYSGYELLSPGDVLEVPTKICGTGIASLELRLAVVPEGPGRMGGEDGATVAIPFPGESTCTSGSSSLSHQRVLPAGSLDLLVRSYSVPSRVRSGQRLDYSVTLTNPTSTAVPLDPCPAYRQALINVLKLPDKQGVTRTGELNCAAAPAGVAAHSSITFQMQLGTTGVPAGDRRLVWDWLGSAWTDARGYAEFPTVTVY
ncbi:hypothetical protein [Jatrophihabitans sp.]|uniref:hypothetical protein n=1 Tax=Jatrophihabitans sp. TaxID=1932789 RepID=UPI002BFEED04|nr:hypothetical protein [Jatrophihabitans sp.]